ncbi:MAG: flagellar export chaperone FliS [Helicobacteraceae bacterium]|jgi:flagellar protein FliS|nr:flagellar export chaperone FliS [Helicobacteraceae bacterium]
MNSSGYSAYAQNTAMVQSPYKLVQMLFEGILKFVTQAKKSMQEGDIEKQVYWINRTIDIFSELMASLDFSEGNESMSSYLQGLYTYQIKLLTEANIECDTARLDTVLRVAQGLLEAWNDETGLGAEEEAQANVEEA